MSTIYAPNRPSRTSDPVAAFTRLFGRALDLWVFSEGAWEHAIDAIAEDLPAGLLETALIDPTWLRNIEECSLDVRVEELSTGIYLVGAPLLIPCEQTGAVETVHVLGTIQADPQDLISTLLRHSQERSLLLRDVVDARRGTVPHLEQISANFEELTWLRRLAEMAAFCDVDDPLVEMSKRLLPELGLLLRAETLVLVTADHPLVTESPTASDARPRVWWFGEPLLNDDECARFISLIPKKPEATQPVVRNNLSSPEWPFTQIRSFVVAPVTLHNRCYGWLVAMNRVAWQPVEGETNPFTTVAIRDNEFGTGDASLMSSAAVMLASQSQTAEMLREKEQLLIGVVRALINAIDAKDSYTCGHSDRVAVIAKCIGQQINLSSRDCEQLYMAGLLHDVGKIGIPDSVLLKPGKLTEEEFSVIKKHPTIGYGILNNLPQLQPILPGVLHHHESFNGQGYPSGLQCEAIPLFARILAVADAYDAMTSCRPYRTAMPREKAESILANGAGTQWDAKIVEAFFSTRPAIEQACQDLFAVTPDPYQEISDFQPQSTSAVVESILRAASSFSGVNHCSSTRST